MAINSKPQTNFYINYGPITNTSAADSLAPVFIAPRYAVHNSAYGNAKIDGTYTGASLALNWEDIGGNDNAVVDTESVSVIFSNPTVEVGASGGSTILFTSGGVNQLNAAVAVGGASSLLDGAYQLRPGDTLQVSGTSGGTAVSGTFGVTSVGAADATVTGGISALDEQSTVAATASCISGGFVGSTTAIYYLDAVVTTSGAAVRANVTALQGDPGYSDSLIFTSGGSTSVGNFGDRRARHRNAECR